MRRVARLLIPALPLLAALTAFASPAHASFNVCNKASLKARVAIGHFDGTNWTSLGWWTIAPKACAAVIKTPLDARYYYLYGTDTASGVWDGETSFCTAPVAKFSVSGRADCTKRGYDRKRFFQVDTEDNLNKVVPLQ